MTDFYMQVLGEFGTTLGWSFGQHITSSSSEATLASEWHDAWQQAWTNGSFGLQTLYPTTTAITDISVATLNATMHEISKTRLALAEPGISSDDTLPYQEAVCVSWRGTNIQKYGRGRWYLPATVETVVNGDALTNTAATRIKNAVAYVYGQMTTSGNTFFVTNKKDIKNKTTGAVIVPAYTKQIVTTPLVATKPARQSRRVRKVPVVYV